MRAQALESQILKMRSSKIQLETRMREEVKQLRKMRREKEQEIHSLKKAMVSRARWAECLRNRSFRATPARCIATRGCRMR